MFSVAATYAVLGKEGVKQYRVLRQKAMDRQGRGLGDSFHDGREVLDVVAEWHKYLTACVRKHDTYTSKVLEIVDQRMLIVPGEDRITGAELSQCLQDIHQDAGDTPAEVPKAIDTFLAEDLKPGRSSRSSPGTISMRRSTISRTLEVYASCFRTQAVRYLCHSATTSSTFLPS